MLELFPTRNSSSRVVFVPPPAPKTNVSSKPDVLKGSAGSTPSATPSSWTDFDPPHHPPQNENKCINNPGVAKGSAASAASAGPAGGGAAGASPMEVDTGGSDSSGLRGKVSANCTAQDKADVSFFQDKAPSTPCFSSQRVNHTEGAHLPRLIPCLVDPTQTQDICHSQWLLLRCCVYFLPLTSYLDAFPVVCTLSRGAYGTREGLLQQSVFETFHSMVRCCRFTPLVFPQRGACEIRSFLSAVARYLLCTQSATITYLTVEGFNYQHASHT